MGKVKVVPGSGSRELAFKVAKVMESELVDVESKYFPDGEIYVRLKGEVEGERVAVIHSMARHPNRLLVEFLLLVRTLKDLGAKEVIGVIPYFPYLRQDARFKSGEAVSAKIISEVIGASGVDVVISVDPHLHRIKDLERYLGIRFKNVTAMRALARYFVERYELKEPILIAPDEEAEQWVKVFSDEMGVDYKILIKERVTPSEVKLRTNYLDIKGRDVIVVDDIISTGTTIAEAAKVLKTAGARRIFATCTHPLLIGDALYKIYRAGVEEVIATDTVASPVSVVSVAPILARTLTT